MVGRGGEEREAIHYFLTAGEEVLLFYWLDAFELPYHQPGTAYLFGKVWHERAAAYIRYTGHTLLTLHVLPPLSSAAVL